MDNRIALVTGAGRGIGRAIALSLAAAGRRGVVTARTKEQLESLVGSIGEAGGQSLAIVADLVDQNAPAQIVERVKKTWGPIEILVNNAGIGSSESPQQLVDYDDDFCDRFRGSGFF